MSKTQRARRTVRNILFREVDFTGGLTFYEIRQHLKAAKLSVPDHLLYEEIDTLAFKGKIQPVESLGGLAWEVAK